MDDTQPGRNGGRLNRGGNEGNRFGAGSPKRDFRIAAGKAALAQLDHWSKVAKGNKCVVVPGRNGSKDALRRPTHEEQERAYVNILLRFGIGTQDEVVVLGNAEALDVFADVLTDMVPDADLVDSILVAVGERLNGQGE